LIKG
jgi:hypothetical protein